MSLRTFGISASSGPSPRCTSAPLEATNGSFSGAVPAEADPSLCKSVIAWCQPFSVRVTWADLR